VTVTTIRSIVAASFCLLSVLISQGPVVGGVVAANGSALTALEQAPPAQTPKPASQGGVSARVPPPDRSPSAQRGGPDRGPGGGSGLTEERWQWWNDSDVKRQLGLGEDTVRTINGIHRERGQKFFPMWKTMTAEFEKLNRMTSDPTVDETSYEAQATKVYYLQSQLDTSRTVMNFRIYKQLRPDQLKKLEEIVQRRSGRSSRDRGPGSSR